MVDTLSYEFSLLSSQDILVTNVIIVEHGMSLMIEALMVV